MIEPQYNRGCMHASKAEQKHKPKQHPTLTCNLLWCWLLAPVGCCQCTLVCVRLEAHRLDSLVVQVEAERNALVEGSLQDTQDAHEYRMHHVCFLAILADT